MSLTNGFMRFKLFLYSLFRECGVLSQKPHSRWREPCTGCLRRNNCKINSLTFFETQFSRTPKVVLLVAAETASDPPKEIMCASDSILDT